MNPFNEVYWRYQKNSRGIEICVVSNDFDILNEHVLSNEFAILNNITIYDNRIKNIGLSKRYNEFIETYLNDNKWLIFMHHDFVFYEDIKDRLNISKENIYGVIGAKRDEEGNRELVGRIKTLSGDFLGRKIDSPEEVFNFDCMCIIAHSSLFRTGLRFDEHIEFHQYAEEICANSKNFGVTPMVIQMDCAHFGMGHVDEEYTRTVAYIKKKHELDDFISTCEY